MMTPLFDFRTCGRLLPLVIESSFVWTANGSWGKHWGPHTQYSYKEQVGRGMGMEERRKEGYIDIVKMVMLQGLTHHDINFRFYHNPNDIWSAYFSHFFTCLFQKFGCIIITIWSHHKYDHTPYRSNPVRSSHTPPAPTRISISLQINTLLTGFFIFLFMAEGFFLWFLGGLLFDFLAHIPMGGVEWTNSTWMNTRFQVGDSKLQDY